MAKPENIKNKKIEVWEPWFFIIFGLFHMHRILGLVDKFKLLIGKYQI